MNLNSRRASSLVDNEPMLGTTTNANPYAAALKRLDGASESDPPLLHGRGGVVDITFHHRFLIYTGL